MTDAARRFALRFLRWATGLVVLWESWRTFYGTLQHLHTPEHSVALMHVRIVLSGAEIAAAVLFLTPRSEKIGGLLLLGIFALASLIHVLHGDFSGMEVLVVYAAAVFACLAFRGSRSAENVISRG
jgi:hypothetical protein